MAALAAVPVGDLVLLVPAAGPDRSDGTGGPLVERVLAALRDSDAAAAVACGPVTDTLKLVGPDGTVLGTAARDRHRVLQPPAAVRASALPAEAAAGTEVRLDLESVLATVVAAGGRVLAVDAELSR